MKRILILIVFCLLLANYIKNAHHQSRIYFYNIPEELKKIITGFSNNLKLCCVSKEFFKITQDCDWYYSKLCNRIINLTINRVQYLSKKNYKERFDTSFLSCNSLLTEEKKQMLVLLYNYYLEILYPRFCPVNFLGDQSRLNKKYYKQTKTDYIACNDLSIRYHIFIFSAGLVITTPCYYGYTEIFLCFMETLLKKHPNIIRIYLFASGRMNFNNIHLNDTVSELLYKNNVIIQDKHAKTPYFLNNNTRAKENTFLVNYESPYDKFLVDINKNYPLLHFVHTKNCQEVKKYLKYSWLPSKEKRQYQSYKVHQKELMDIEKQLNTEKASEKTALLLTFPSDNTELKNIFVKYR